MGDRSFALCCCGRGVWTRSLALLDVTRVWGRCLPLRWAVVFIVGTVRLFVPALVADLGRDFLLLWQPLSAPFGES